MCRTRILPKCFGALENRGGLTGVAIAGIDADRG
jgi:hypothetical protein